MNHTDRKFEHYFLFQRAMLDLLDSINEALDFKYSQILV